MQRPSVPLDEDNYHHVYTTVGGYVVEDRKKQPMRAGL